MFIKVPVFKKLLKQAFAANRMKVKMDRSGLTVDCGHFAVWFEKEHIPNKIKSAIVELAGEIPEEGKAFLAQKSGNQYEMDSAVLDLRNLLRQTDKRYVQTPIVYSDNYDTYRFLQMAGKPDNIKLVADIFIQLLDPHELDHVAAEGTIQGPYSMETGMLFFWATDLCTISVCAIVPHRDIVEKTIMELADIDFEGDYSGLEER